MILVRFLNLIPRFEGWGGMWRAGRQKGGGTLGRSHSLYNVRCTQYELFCFDCKYYCSVRSMLMHICWSEPGQAESHSLFEQYTACLNYPFCWWCASHWSERQMQNSPNTIVIAWHTWWKTLLGQAQLILKFFSENPKWGVHLRSTKSMQLYANFFVRTALIAI